MSLDDLRRRIDAIDASILRLLEERARVAADVAETKRREGRTSVYDPERERALVERLQSLATGDLPPAALRAIYREVIAACRAVQKRMQIAHLGPDGTFSQSAAQAIFGDAVDYLQTTTIEGVFDAVSSGQCARGVVPVENSTEGSVGPTLRALLESDVQIEREMILEVRYCLVTNAPSLHAIRRVLSHPQALGQCAQWLRRNLPDVERVPTHATAAALDALPGAATDAALVSPIAALGTPIPTLVHAVADDARNATRFLVVGPHDAAATGDDRTTIAFELRDRPGALRAALGAFEGAGVNLSHLESLPSRRAAWAWTFVCDLEGHRTDDRVAAALDALRAGEASVRVLGSYPRATELTSLLPGPTR